MYTGKIEAMKKCGHVVTVEYGSIYSVSKERIALEALREDCAECQHKARQWKLSVVGIDGGKNFAAYVLTTQHWNGWSIPFFTKEQAELVAAEQSEHGVAIKYLGNDEDGGMDAYECNTEPNQEDTVEIYEGEDIVVDGQTIHTYPIGGWSWIWDTITREEMLDQLHEAASNLDDIGLMQLVASLTKA